VKSRLWNGQLHSEPFAIERISGAYMGESSLLGHHYD